MTAPFTLQDYCMVNTLMYENAHFMLHMKKCETLLFILETFQVEYFVHL